MTTHPLNLANHLLLELHATTAAISIMPVEPGQDPRLEAVGSGDVPIPVSFAESDGRLRATIGHDSAFSFWDFSPHPRPHAAAPEERHFGPHARVRLWLPDGVRARVSTDFGRIRAEGLQGCELDLGTSAGTIQVRGVDGRLRLHSSAGAISAREVGGSFEVRTGAGLIKLAIDRLDEGHHRVHSSMGAVKVWLAPGLDVRLKASTNMGSVRTRYPSNNDSPRVLELVTDLGSVRAFERAAMPEAEDWFDAETWFAWAERHWRDHARSPHGMRGAEWWHRPAAYAALSASSPTPAEKTAAPDELKRILHLVQAGKVSPEDAELLLRAIEE